MDAYDATTGDHLVFGVTNPSGNYSFSLGTDSYHVQFYDECDALVNEYLIE